MDAWNRRFVTAVIRLEAAVIILPQRPISLIFLWAYGPRSLLFWPSIGCDDNHLGSIVPYRATLVVHLCQKLVHTRPSRAYRRTVDGGFHIFMTTTATPGCGSTPQVVSSRPNLLPRCRTVTYLTYKHVCGRL